MSTALNWSKSGSSDKQDIIEFIDKFGTWLVKEFEKEILENL